MPLAALAALSLAQASQGALVTFESAGASDTRPARLVALYVPQGSPASPFLAIGPFHAAWRANLTARLRTECAFSAEFSGSLEVTINGQPALGKTVTLNKGKNQLEARYSSPPTGDAYLRLFWAPGRFPAEPIPPMELSFDPKAEGPSGKLRRGRELFGALRCFKCHMAPDRGMPELAMDAPALDAAGARFRAGWLAEWISNPRAFRPDTAMPALFPPGDDRAGQIAAYLAGLGSEERLPDPVPEKARAGGLLYAQLGCVGCHSLKASDDGRVPLSHLGAKWKPGALVQYLIKPDKLSAWSRMPDFHLSGQEAESLAAFLLSRAGPGSAPVPEPRQGRKHLEMAGCLRCHTLTGAAAAPAQRTPLADASRGCLSPEPQGVPDFRLSSEDREALRAFLGTDRSSLARESAPEFLERQVRALRCAACHRRDGRDDAWSEREEETEALLQEFGPKKKDEEVQDVKVEETRPSLTWAGEKLRPEWIRTFLSGELPYKPRPWLKARMPSFRARAPGLAEGMALEHGFSPSAAPAPKADPTLAQTGRKLLGRQGFNCVACHDTGSAPATQVFEARGPNFMHAASRMRRDYYLRWVWDPGRIEPGSKMPKFAKDDGKTDIPDLDRDASRQYEAIWQYLQSGEAIIPPD